MRKKINYLKLCNSKYIRIAVATMSSLPANPTKMFISTVKELMSDLMEAFPDRKHKIKAKYMMLESVEKSSGKSIIAKYIKYVFPHLDKVIRKDDIFLTSDEFTPPLLSDLEISTWWGGASQDIKDTTWKYIHLLNFLATKVHPQSPEVNTVIETVWSKNYC